MNVQVMASSEVASGFDGWLGTGKQLLSERNAIDWRLADWIAEGRTSFGNQAAFDFLADELGIEPKALKSAAKVAVAFPPALRDASLTFEHHESVATLERPEALAVLKRAKAEHWDNRETRMAAVRRQTEIADRTLFARDRTDDDYQRICRAWNRADMDARRLFLEQIEETQMEDIDA